MILVFLEWSGDHLELTSQQTVTFTRTVAERLNIPFEAVLFGKATPAIEADLQRFGVTKAHFIAHGKLDRYAPVAFGKVMVQLAAAVRARAVFAPATERGNEMMTHAAVQAKLPLATNVCAIEPGEEWSVTRQRWGGSLYEESLLLGNPKLLTVAQHIVLPQEAVAASIRTEVFQPALEEKDFRGQVVRVEKAPDDKLNLKTAALVIGGGRGVGSAEGFGVLERLAGLLNGVVGGSRVATNNGWRPHTHQIGLTGNRITPKLYIACGISGSIQHRVGCKGAKHILVINTDKDAPFFSDADYGIVGDLHQVVPAICAEVGKAGVS